MNLEPSHGGPSSGSRGTEARLTFAGLIGVAALVGMIVGSIEVAIVLEALRLGNLVRTGMDVVWMAPLADLGASLLVGGILFVVGRWVPGARELPVVLGILVGVGGFALLLTTRHLHPLASLVFAAGLGATTGRFMRGKSLRFGAHLHRVAILVTIGLAIGSASYILLPRPRPSTAPPDGPSRTTNVLLIILDTVRAKSLTIHGRQKETSPWLEEFAEESVVFDRAVAPAPWTLPSHASMFTGQPPFRLSAAFDKTLDDAYPTLAEALARQGYATAGFVANLLYTNRATGLARGFEHYEDYPVSFGQVLLSVEWGRRLADWDWLRDRLGHHQLLNRKRAARVVADFADWLDQKGDRPFFAFLNLYDAHEPYTPPYPYDRLFHPPEDRGPLHHTVSLLGGNEAVRPNKWSMTSQERELDLSLYEGAIAYMDSQLQKMSADLKSRGIWDETLVIVTSDHGEQFGEHGLYRHINSVYMPLLHVPFAMRLPGRLPEGTRVASPVSLRQIPATVIDLLQIDSVHEFPGPSLSQTWAREPTSPPAPFSELVPGLVQRDWYPVAGGRLRSIVSGPYHYIRSEDGAEELYDIERDPDEAANLIRDPAHAATLVELRTTLDATLVPERHLTGDGPPSGPR